MAASAWAGCMNASPMVMKKNNPSNGRQQPLFFPMCISPYPWADYVSTSGLDKFVVDNFDQLFPAGNIESADGLI